MLAVSLTGGVGLFLMILGTLENELLMRWGLWFSMIAATLLVRQMLAREARARNAFELGRDYERKAS